MNVYNFKYICIIFFNCKGQSQERIFEYPKRIGDIEFSFKIDERNFKLCSQANINHYFYGGKGVQYKGEKFELEETFFKFYKNQNILSESGLIRIQFIVNCEGKTDRFRIISMNNEYQEKIFDKRITSQLLSITKNLKGWKPKDNKDYYQYLIFRIVDGNLIEIMP